MAEKERESKIVKGLDIAAGVSVLALAATIGINVAVDRYRGPEVRSANYDYTLRHDNSDMLVLDFKLRDGLKGAIRQQDSNCRMIYSPSEMKLPTLEQTQEIKKNLLPIIFDECVAENGLYKPYTPKPQGPAINVRKDTKAIKYLRE